MEGVSFFWHETPSPASLPPAPPSACWPRANSKAQSARPRSPAKLIDLTHPFDEQAIYWPNAEPFRWRRSDGILENSFDLSFAHRAISIISAAFPFPERDARC
jgi:hypothetical protein